MFFAVCASSWFHKGLGFRGFVQGRLGLRSSGGGPFDEDAESEGLYYIWGNNGQLGALVWHRSSGDLLGGLHMDAGCLMQAPDKHQWHCILALLLAGAFQAVPSASNSNHRS